MPAGSNNHDYHHGDVHLTLDALLVRTKYINSWRRRHGLHTLRLGNFAVLLSSVSGRDKVYRFLQASIKLAVWILSDVMEADLPRHVAVCSPMWFRNNTLFQRLNRIASAFSAGRRFIRIGHTPGAIKGLIEGLRYDSTEFGYRWATFVSRLFGVIFLHLDHITWLATLGVLPLNMEKQGVLSSICAFVNTFAQIVSDTITIMRLDRQRKQLLENLKKTPQDETATEAIVDQVNASSSLSKNLIYNCIRNALDLPGQLNGVYQWKSVPQSVWTILAFFSSSVGVWQSWPAKADTA